MKRRRFLQLVGTASVASRSLSAAASPGATVLYDDRATALAETHTDPADPAALWVRTRDLPRVNGFEVKPQGACRADVCIPIAKTMRRGAYFNLSAFAHKVGEPVVADLERRVWSFGEIRALGGGFLASRVAPDFTVPDRTGRQVHLSDFRGKKVLVVTWASW
jgi:hypothetical protein